MLIQEMGGKGMIELLNMDCMDYLKDCPDNAFELAIVDPPYGIGDFSMTNPKGANRKHLPRWEYSWNNATPDPKYFDEIRRVSEHQIIWGCNYYNQFSPEGGAVVWFKNNPHPHMSKCEIASVTQHKRVEFIHINWSNTDRVNRLKGAGIHPCQKPVELYQWLLKNYATPGDRILDTHAGSMSSVIAAHYAGHDIVAIELDKDYFEAGKKRVEDETRQFDLF